MKTRLRRWILLAATLCVLQIAGCEKSENTDETYAGMGTTVYSEDDAVFLEVNFPSSLRSIQMIPAVLHKDGAISVPLITRKVPRKGFMDRVYYEDRIQSPLLGIVSSDTVAVPSTPDVASYVFVIRKAEDDPWKWFEVDKEHVAGGRGVVDVPSFDRLNQLSNAPFSVDFWNRYETAQQIFVQSEERR